MGFSLSALGRSRVQGRRSAARGETGGVYVTLDGLTALEMAARGF